MRTPTLLAGLLIVPFLMGASYETRNFIVKAPTAKAAEEFGKAAEVYRRQKAIDWLGKEMPPWPQKCPLTVTITMNGAGGATTFQYGAGYPSMSMQIEGAYDRLLNSVLPHEVTHTVFAHHFRCPVPRWADEGGSVLSEDAPELNRHDRLCRQMLNAGRAMPLRRLFSLTEYPSDVMVLYAEGFSVTRFLVDMSNRQTFLNFVAFGMTYDWDQAAQRFYQFKNIEAMEKEWIESLRRPRNVEVAAAARNTEAVAARPTSRHTGPIGTLNLEPALVSRGQSPTPGQEGQTFGNLRMGVPTGCPNCDRSPAGCPNCNRAPAMSNLSMGMPTHLPVSREAVISNSQPSTQPNSTASPASPALPGPPPVRLGLPEPLPPQAYSLPQ